jgi:quaternary ammonium compound-resistance protein SugE
MLGVYAVHFTSKLNSGRGAPYPVRTRRREERDMSWIILIIAGLLEICWSVGLKYTNGFTRPLPSLLVGLAIVASLFLLGVAVRTLPLGTAYAVWVGIGLLGASIADVMLFNQPFSAARAGFLVLLVVALAGLKATTQK